MSERATPITERDRSRSKCGQRLRDSPHVVGPVVVPRSVPRELSRELDSNSDDFVPAP